MDKILFLFYCVFFFSCKNEVKQVEEKSPICLSDTLRRILRIDSATFANIGDEVKLTGEISFSDNKVVKVFPFSSGKVIQVKVSIGDKVSRGQVLAVIQSAEVEGNYADLSSANNDVAVAKKQMDNAEALFKNGIGSEREFVEAKENYLKAETASGKIRNQIKINGGGNTSADGKYVVTAPIDGFVVEKTIESGGFIRMDNANSLFTIGDISELWLWANVYETDIAKVQPGYSAKVTTLAYPDSVFRGTIDRLNQILDPVSKVMKVLIRIPNKGLVLKPQMFANIIVQNQEGRKALQVPESAVISDQGKSYVVQYFDTCHLEVKEVQVLKTVDKITYLQSGIDPGTKVICGNQVLLYRAIIDNR